MITTPTKPKVQLVLTSDEQQALIDLIDAAVRAQGLNVANNALCLALKVKNAPVVDDTAKTDRATAGELRLPGTPLGPVGNVGCCGGPAGTLGPDDSALAR